MKNKANYYDVFAVMELLVVSKDTAYRKIRELNLELAAKGYLIRRGMVPKKYFNERYGI